MAAHLNRLQLEVLKRQLASITPHMSQHQIYTLVDLLFEAARERVPEDRPVRPSVDVRI